MTAWSGRASPSTSGRSGGTPRRCCARPRAPSCGPSSRPRATGTARSTSRRRRSRAVRPRSASRRCPRRSTFARRSETRASSSWGPSPSARSARRASRGSSSSRRTAGSRRACRSTSSSTPGWAGGDSRSCPSPTRDVVGVMSHLASAESDPAFTQLQVERFREATAALGSLTRHLANSAATLRYAEARFDAVRCGIALYGISPFGTDPGARRARAGAALGVVPRARQAARAGREHGLRPPVRRRPRRRGSASSRSATRTASGAT